MSFNNSLLLCQRIDPEKKGYVYIGAHIPLRGGRRVPRGSDGMTAFTDDMNVAVSAAQFLTSSYRVSIQ